MRVLTIIGTRPEIIRLSIIINKLDSTCEHILVHTGQNYDYRLNELFFKELKIRKPDEFMNAKGSLGQQIGTIMVETERILKKYNPDKVLILGDTNSGLSAIICERMGVPVYHMEAGNRCGEQMPEEINRHIIDSVCSINLPYTNKSKENLLREGFNPKKIIVSGNPIYEVIKYYEKDINKSKVLDKLNLIKKDYVLVTLHRQENVDNKDRFIKILKAFNKIANKKFVIVSTHPRTKDKLKNTKIELHPNIKFLKPFGFFDFVKLEKEANCIITDSGTVQEEACILRTPCVIARKTTERMETIECGASILSGINTNDIYECYLQAIKIKTVWACPEGYIDYNVSNKVINYLFNKI